MKRKSNNWIVVVLLAVGMAILVIGLAVNFAARTQTDNLPTDLFPLLTPVVTLPTQTSTGSALLGLSTPSPVGTTTPGLDKAASPTPGSQKDALGTLRFGLGRGIVQSMAFSPEGKTFAVLNQQGVIFFSSGALVEQHQIHFSHQEGSLFYQSDGILRFVSYRAQSDNGPGIDIAEVTLTGLKAYWFIPTNVEWFMVSANGNRIATMEETPDGSLIHVWDISSKAEESSFASIVLPSEARTHRRISQLVDFSADLSRIVVARTSGAGEVNVLQSDGDAYRGIFTTTIAPRVPDYDQDGTPDYLDYTAEGKSALSVAISPDGRYIAVGGPDHVTRVFEPGKSVDPTMQLNATIEPGKETYSTAVKFSNDGQMLITGLEKLAYVYRVGTWKLLGIQRMQDVIALSKNGMLASAVDDQVLFSSVSKGMQYAVLNGFAQEGAFDVAEFSPDGMRLAVGRGAALYLWNVNASNESRRLAMAGKVQNVTFSANGKNVAAIVDRSVDDRSCSRVGIWDVSNGAAIAALEDENLCVHGADLAFSPDGKWLAMSTGMGLQLWYDVNGSYQLMEYAQNSKPGNVAFTADSTTVVYQEANWDFSRHLAADATQLMAYTLKSKALEIILMPHRGSFLVRSAAEAGWSPALGWVATAVNSSGAIITGRNGHLEEQSNLGRLAGFLPETYQFDLKGKLVAGQMRNQVLFWDAIHGEFRGFLPAISGGSVEGVVFSEDGGSALLEETGGLLEIWSLPGQGEPAWSGLLSVRKPTVDEIRGGLPSIWDAIHVTVESLYLPGTLTYKGDVDSDTEYLWPYLWCAQNDTLLTNNLNAMQMQFLVNNEAIRKENIATIPYSLKSGWSCQYWAVAVSKWHAGAQMNLTILYTIANEISDGQSIFPAGEYRIKLLADVK